MIDPEILDDSERITPRTLRQFGALCLVLFGGLAARSAAAGGVRAAVMLSVIAIAVGVRGLISPEAIRPVFMALMTVTRPVGLLVNRLVLGALYYGVFTPLAVIFRLRGRDALQRRRHPRDTYWLRRADVKDLTSYFRS